MNVYIMFPALGHCLSQPGRPSIPWIFSAPWLPRAGGVPPHPPSPPPPHPDQNQLNRFNRFSRSGRLGRSGRFNWLSQMDWLSWINLFGWPSQLCRL